MKSLNQTPKIMQSNNTEISPRLQTDPDDAYGDRIMVITQMNYVKNQMTKSASESKMNRSRM
jgi:hypothetical protein